MKDSPLDKGLIVFSDVDKESSLYPYISEKIPTGSLGEAYTPLTYHSKNSPILCSRWWDELPVTDRE